MNNRQRKVLWVLGAVGAVSAGVLWLAARYEIVIRLKSEVPVLLRGAVPLRAAVEQRIDVGLAEDIAAKVRLGQLEIPLHETLELPLHLALKVPIDSEVSVDDPLSIALQVPIDTVLTERNLDLSQLEVPIDTDVFVDDAIDVQAVVPLDSEVQTTLGIRVPVKANLPIKVRVPIRQKIHVQDRIRIHPDKLRIPLRATLPVNVQVKLTQKLRVRGSVDVPVHQNVRIPLHQTIHPAIDRELPVRVHIAGQVPAQLKATLNANVAIEQAIPTSLGAIRIGAGELSLDTKRAETSGVD